LINLTLLLSALRLLGFLMRLLAAGLLDLRVPLRLLSLMLSLLLMLLNLRPMLVFPFSLMSQFLSRFF
jgi:hypothetical protein